MNSEKKFVTGTITGSTAPTSVGKLSLGNTFQKETLVPFLAGAALIGVLLLAYFMPLMIQLGMDRVEARMEAKFAEVRVKTDIAKQDAKIAKEDALSALTKVEEKLK